MNTICISRSNIGVPKSTVMLLIDVVLNLIHPELLVLSWASFEELISNCMQIISELVMLSTNEISLAKQKLESKSV